MKIFFDRKERNSPLFLSILDIKRLVLFLPSWTRGSGDVKNEKNAGGGEKQRSIRESKKGKTGREIDLITGLPVSLDVFRGDRMRREWILAAAWGTVDGSVASFPRSWPRLWPRRCRRRVIPFVGCKSKPQRAVDRRNGHELLHRSNRWNRIAAVL